MPCQNGKPSWFIMGCSLGMVAGWPTFDMLIVQCCLPLLQKIWFTCWKLWFRNLQLLVCNWTRRKQKKLTTSPSESSAFVNVCGEMVHIIHAETVHKYLGRNLGGNFLARRNFEFVHRWQVAWNKFRKYKHILLNKHVSLVLRLKLFDAVVSPAMRFGLATLPLTKSCLQKLGVVQTRTLRSIIGWARIHDDLSWRDIMVQMNHKLVIAKTLFPMEGWEGRLFRSKFRLAHRIARSPEGWPAKSVSWNPLTNWESNFACKPHRKRGRPLTRWDDILTNCSSEFFHNDNWWHVAREASSWFTSEKFYVQFCL